MKTRVLYPLVVCLFALAVCVPALATGYNVRDLGKPELPSGTTTTWKGMNMNGQIVGSVIAGAYSHAYVYTPGSGGQDIGTLTGDASSYGYGINDLGQVVGLSLDANRVQHAFLYTPGIGMSTFGLPGASTVFPMAINNAGQVTGQYKVSDGEWRGFIYTPGSSVIDLGTGRLGNAISASGWVAVGYSSIFIPGRGIVSSGADLTASAPAGINDLGQIAVAGGYGRGASVYDWQTKTTTALSSLGGNYGCAYAIDNTGRIVGLATDSSAYIHVVEWTPTPEPSSILAMLAGLGSLGAFVTRRRK